jgi:hypothetical protein
LTRAQSVPDAPGKSLEIGQLPRSVLLATIWSIDPPPPRQFS